MNLLVVTQAVDENDPALGFFVRWLEEFAKHAEHIEVICLKEGKHDSLPANVRVHSLGKERGRPLLGALTYAIRFKRLAWRLRRRYDLVFVHMNEEYALLGGWLWKWTGKNVYLWRNHKKGSWRTRLAARFARAVFYTSSDAFAARFQNGMRMPVGIDTDFFRPEGEPPADSVLFLGRIDPVKKVELFIAALMDVRLPFKAGLYGSPTEPGSPYGKRIVKEARPLVTRGVLSVHAGVSYAQTRRLYQSHAIYLNLTPSGSFDKTIGEAMASGCLVVCANSALKGVLPEKLIPENDAPQAVADALRAALSMDDAARRAVRESSREYIDREHSLRLLVKRLERVFRSETA